MSLAHWVKYKPGFYAQILHQYVVLPYRENQQTLELYNFCHLPSRCSHQEVTKILHFAYFCSRVRLFFSSGFWLWIEVLWKQNHWTKLRLIIQTCRHICMALPPVWHLYDICSYCCRIPHIQRECHLYQNRLAVVFHVYCAWFVSVQGLSLEWPTHGISWKLSQKVEYHPISRGSHSQVVWWTSHSGLSMRFQLVSPGSCLTIISQGEQKLQLDGSSSHV